MQRLTHNHNISRSSSSSRCVHAALDSNTANQKDLASVLQVCYWGEIFFLTGAKQKAVGMSANCSIAGWGGPNGCA